MLNKSSSFNGKIILEAYTHTEVKADIRSGWATINQKTSLKGLTVLIQAILSDGTIIPSGSTAYIKEELLHTQPWAKNKLKSDTLSKEFIIVGMNEIEYIDPPFEGNAA